MEQRILCFWPIWDNWFTFLLSLLDVSINLYVLGLSAHKKIPTFWSMRGKRVVSSVEKQSFSVHSRVEGSVLGWLGHERGRELHMDLSFPNPSIIHPGEVSNHTFFSPFSHTFSRETKVRRFQVFAILLHHSSMIRCWALISYISWIPE